MNVLTFGDKPAPAMAQVALRKTAEGESDSPRATQTIKDNSYMDDIFDSVQTNNEATELTAEIDGILKKGGFQVKGWTSNAELSPKNNRKEPEEINVLKENRICNNGNYNVRNRLQKVFKLEETCTSCSLGPKDENEVTGDTCEKQNCRKRTVDTAKT